MYFMVVIVDFDYTLFDTYSFFNAFKEVFLKNGVTEEDRKRTYDETIVWKGGEMGYDYSFEKQVDRLMDKGYILDRKKIIEELYGCLNNTFLYPDAEDFLLSMKKNFPNRTLLTAGNPDYQRTKVEGVGIGEYFTDFVYINGDKHLYITEAFKNYDSIIFINDNLKENVVLKEIMPHAHIITKFNQRRNTIEELRESGIPYFETLTAIKEYVTNELI